MLFKLCFSCLLCIHGCFACYTDLQVKRNDNGETALPNQGGIPGNKATSNSNNEHALYQLLGLVRKGDSLCNIRREGIQNKYKIKPLH